MKRFKPLILSEMAIFWISYISTLITIIFAAAFDTRWLIASVIIVAMYIRHYCITDEFSERSLKQCRSERDEHEEGGI